MKLVPKQNNMMNMSKVNLRYQNQNQNKQFIYLNKPKKKKIIYKEVEEEEEEEVVYVKKINLNSKNHWIELYINHLLNHYI